MLSIKKILCSIDFSEHASESLKFALQLAEANKADLHLYHVAPLLQFYDLSMASINAGFQAAQIQEENKIEAEKKLAEMAADLVKAHPSLSISNRVSSENDAAGAVIAEAKNEMSDLIVMGSHGRRGLSRILMGSVAESVMRHASCNVLILKPADKK